MKTTNRSFYKCVIMSILLGFSLTAAGETINDDLSVTGTLNIEADTICNGELWGTKINGLNNPVYPDNGASIDFASPNMAGQDIVLTGGKGMYFGGSIRLNGGNPHLGTTGIGNVVLTGKDIVLNGNVKLGALTGPAGGSFNICGANGRNGGPYSDPTEGQDITISSGQGGTGYYHNDADDGDVVLKGQTIECIAKDSVSISAPVDLHGNALKNAYIEPCGGLSMGEFDAQ